jgi:hypothetical protein
MVVVHTIKLPQENCNNILNMIQNSTDKNKIETMVGKTEGYTPCCVTDLRELEVWKTWKDNKEVQQIIYKSKKIDEQVPENIFDYFNINKNKCVIDVRRFFPGKLHVPHKDYYFNLSYSEWEAPPKNALELKDRLEKMKTLSKEILQPKNIVRLWISLTEPKFGHVLMIEDKVLYWLEQGSIVTWDIQELHSAANVGYEDRFIMRITGYLNESA